MLKVCATRRLGTKGSLPSRMMGGGPGLPLPAPLIRATLHTHTLLLTSAPIVLHRESSIQGTIGCIPSHRG